MANRAVVWEGGSKNLLEGSELVVRDKPRACAGRVVVRMLARAVSVEEFMPLELRYNFQHIHRSGKVVVGMEGCGIIEELGEGVSKLRLGQRVHVFFPESVYEELGEGAWQDYVEIAEDDLLHVPDFMSTEVAAQQLSAWTAYALLVDLAEYVPKGEYLLQTAAGSTVGRLVIRLAKHWGLKTINVVRREELKEELKNLGADEVINSTTEDDVIARVKDITGGRGAFTAIDSVGGIISKLSAFEMVEKCWQLVRWKVMTSHECLSSTYVEVFS